MNEALRKFAASEKGVQFASRMVGPVLGAAAIPAGLGLSLYGSNLRGVAKKVEDDIEKAKGIREQYEEAFGPDVIGSWAGDRKGLAYDPFDPKGETYAHWRRLRKLKFLEPYIRAGHEGLITPISRKSEAVDVIKNLRRMIGKWTPSAQQHYSSFTHSPRSALKQLAHEGLDYAGVKGHEKAVREVLEDYDELAAKWGRYEGLRKLYNQPWAKVSLRNPRSVKVYTEKYGQDALEEARRKQEILFYASRVMMFAPKYYGGVVTGSNLVGGALGVGGAALAGIGGYKGISSLLRYLKKGAAAGGPIKHDPLVSEGDIEPVTPVEEKVDPREEAKAQPFSDILRGANPFSLKPETLGVRLRPETKKEEMTRVIPTLLGKMLVGALVVPSMARGGVELMRGAFRQGPYAASKLPGGRLKAMATGTLYGLTIPFLALKRALTTGKTLKALEKGKVVDSKALQRLGTQMGETPIRHSKAVSEARQALLSGLPISPELAAAARKEVFEPNTTILLNALLGGGITGYAGYASYARAKRLREAFEQVYGEQLPPEVAAVILNPAKVRQLARIRRENLLAQRQARRQKERKERRKARAAQRGKGRKG